MTSIRLSTSNFTLLQGYASQANVHTRNSFKLLQQMQNYPLTLNQRMSNTLRNIQAKCHKVETQMTQINNFMQESASKYQLIEKRLRNEMVALSSLSKQTIINPYVASRPTFKKRDHSVYDAYVAKANHSFTNGLKLNNIARILKGGVALAGSLSFDLAGASMQNKVGGLSVKGNVSVGHAELSGKVRVALKKDDVFDPSINIKVGAEAALAQGIAKISFANDLFTANATASGELGSAEAKGKVSISKKGVNVEGEVGVAAAKGKLTGSFKIFGIKFTATAHGEAGALGVGGKFQAEDSSFEVGAKLSCIFGGGFNFKIDW